MDTAPGYRAGRYRDLKFYEVASPRPSLLHQLLQPDLLRCDSVATELATTSLATVAPVVTGLVTTHLVTVDSARTGLRTAAPAYQMTGFDRFSVLADGAAIRPAREQIAFTVPRGRPASLAISWKECRPRSSSTCRRASVESPCCVDAPCIMSGLDAYCSHHVTAPGEWCARR